MFKRNSPAGKNRNKNKSASVPKSAIGADNCTTNNASALMYRACDAPLEQVPSIVLSIFSVDTPQPNVAKFALIRNLTARYSKNIFEFVKNTGLYLAMQDRDPYWRPLVFHMVEHVCMNGSPSHIQIFINRLLNHHSDMKRADGYIAKRLEKFDIELFSVVEFIDTALKGTSSSFDTFSLGLSSLTLEEMNNPKNIEYLKIFCEEVLINTHKYLIKTHFKSMTIAQLTAHSTQYTRDTIKNLLDLEFD